MAVLIGTTSVAGGSNTTFGADEAAGTRYQCVTSGTLETLSMYARTSAGSITLEFAVYSDSAGNPDSLLGKTTAVTAPGSDTVVSSSVITPFAVTSGTFYWLFMLVNSPGSFLNATMTASGQMRGDDGTTDFPSTWDTAGDFTDAVLGMPIQGDGTASGGAVSIPTLVMAPPRPY